MVMIITMLALDDTTAGHGSPDKQFLVAAVHHQHDVALRRALGSCAPRRHGDTARLVTCKYFVVTSSLRALDTASRRTGRRAYDGLSPLSGSNVVLFSSHHRSRRVMTAVVTCS